MLGLCVQVPEPAPPAPVPVVQQPLVIALPPIVDFYGRPQDDTDYEPSMDSADEDESDEADDYVPLVPADVEMTDEESGMDAVSEDDAGEVADEVFEEDLHRCEDCGRPFFIFDPFLYTLLVFL